MTKPNEALTSHPATEPHLETLLTCQQTKAALGIGTTKLYELIGLGQLDARKLGNGTRITASSIARFQAELPSAVMRTARRNVA